MSETDEGVQLCQECGQPLLPQTTKDQPQPPYDGPANSPTANAQVQDVCVNQDCPRFAKPNDPFETSS